MTADYVTESAETLAEALAGEYRVWLGDAYGSHPVEVSPELARHLAAALIASGAVRPADEVRAEAWEQGARESERHGVALDKGRGIVCLCGEVCNAVIRRSPAPLLGTTSDDYVAVNAGTVFARHLRAVNDRAAANPYAGSDATQ